MSVPPEWLRQPPAGWTMRSLFWHNVRRYHNLIRLFYVVPAHTANTRTQAFQLLLLQLQLTAVGVVIVLGAEQCTRTQAFLAPFLASLCSSPIVMLHRLLFRWAMLHGEHGRVFHTFDRERRRPPPRPVGRMHSPPVERMHSPACWGLGPAEARRKEARRQAAGAQQQGMRSCHLGGEGDANVSLTSAAATSSGHGGGGSAHGGVRSALEQSRWLLPSMALLSRRALALSSAASPSRRNAGGLPEVSVVRGPLVSTGSCDVGAISLAEISELSVAPRHANELSAKARAAEPPSSDLRKTLALSETMGRLWLAPSQLAVSAGGADLLFYVVSAQHGASEHEPASAPPSKSGTVPQVVIVAHAGEPRLLGWQRAATEDTAALKPFASDACRSRDVPHDDGVDPRDALRTAHRTWASVAQVWIENGLASAVSWAGYSASGCVGGCPSGVEAERRVLVHFELSSWPPSVPMRAGSFAVPTAEAASAMLLRAASVGPTHARSLGYLRAVQSKGLPTNHASAADPALARCQSRPPKALSSVASGTVAIYLRRAATSMWPSAPDRSRPWPLLHRGWSVRLTLVWMLHLLVTIFSWLLLLQFLLVGSAEHSARQEMSSSEYLGSLAGAFCVAILSSLLVQEVIKVALITLVSPQMLPSVVVFQQTKAREAVRLCMRGVLGFLYIVLRSI